MRLSVPIYEPFSTPEEWAAIHKKHGYSAAYCPIKSDAPDDVVAQYRQVARDNDIIIPEVGAWYNNPLSYDPEERERSIVNTIRQLEFAEKLGAHCCVNIAGSRAEVWDAPHPENFSKEVFDMTVASIQRILDTVQPKIAAYTLEMMPWVIPDSPQSYLDLMEAVDRPMFHVHLDPTNIINSIYRYYDSGSIIRECFQKLGKYIHGVHGKDVFLPNKLTLQLQETCPGRGMLDYRTLLSCMEETDPDMPLVLEHMSSQELYMEGEAYVRGIAAELGIIIK